MKQLGTIGVLALFGTVLSIVVRAQAAADNHLTAPRTSGGMPLMEALARRHTSRSFSPRPLPAQELSDLLWAAFGVNRRQSGKRTAPSAVNWQEIDIYVVTARGAYVFDARTHGLKMVTGDDLRAQTGTQTFVADAPLNLVYVADYRRMGRVSDEQKSFYAACDTGFIAQNVYLYCASEGLNTVVRGSVPRDRLSAALGLSEAQHITLAQTVGYPPE